MISLGLSLLVLVIGYLVWSRLAERVFSPDERPTPALSMTDGVDCVPLKAPRAFLIQLLNIAGTGPIYGALMGAVFGPRVFLWIVFGSILGGGIHDYFTGMISCRNGGASIAELAGKYLGKAAKYIMRAFSVILLVLVGTVFVTSPASLLYELTNETVSQSLFVAVILAYYLLATLLPIDKLIGKLYPVFGTVLILMAVGITAGLIAGGYTVPEIWSGTGRPDDLPTWPFMFITVACGAISGFHATQSPMVAKCVTSEKHGRRVFYGAMISEAVIALVWAAAGVAFYGSTEVLNGMLTKIGQSAVVYDISTGLLGVFGGILALIGVVACPITSGDTAFRAARLILAECLHLPQERIRNRLLLTLPLLGIGSVLTAVDFDVIWRYFSWSNQTLAMIALWTVTAYLIKEKKYTGSLISAVPAVFMSAVSVTYILMAEEGLKLSAGLACPVGASFALAAAAIYTVCVFRAKRKAKDL